MTTKSTSFRLSTSTLTLLKQLAEKDNRSLTNMVETLIQEKAEQNEKGKVKVTEKELVNAVVTLAEECKKDHPMVAGVLFHLAGSITAGPEWLRRTFDVTAQESKNFIQFVTGENETRN